jgi:hypothetical protein
LPLKRVEAVYLLAPRENLLFLLFHLLQGRGDELIVWVNYQARPEQSIEVARQGDRQFAKRLVDKDKPALSMQEPIRKLQLAAEEKPGTLLLGKVKDFIGKYPSSIIRLAIRPEKPHLYLRINLRMMRASKATDLLLALKDLAA